MYLILIIIFNNLTTYQEITLIDVQVKMIDFKEIILVQTHLWLNQEEIDLFRILLILEIILSIHIKI
jgi:hypothetical protein